MNVLERDRMEALARHASEAQVAMVASLAVPLAHAVGDWSSVVVVTRSCIRVHRDKHQHLET